MIEDVPDDPASKEALAQNPVVVMSRVLRDMETLLSMSLRDGNIRDQRMIFVALKGMRIVAGI